MDILGPFPKTISGYEYLFMAIDRLIKWLEVVVITKIDKHYVVKFL